MIDTYLNSVSDNYADGSLKNMGDYLRRSVAALEKRGLTITETGVQIAENAGKIGTQNQQIAAILMDWMDALQKSSISPKTLNLYVITLRGFFGWLHRRFLIESDFAQTLKTINADKMARVARRKAALAGVDYDDGSDRRRAYTVAEATTLMDSNAGYHKLRDNTMAALLLCSGMRGSEICQLTIRNGYEIINDAMIRGLSRKGNKTMDVPVSDSMRETMREYLDSRLDALNTTFDAAAENDEVLRLPLFITQRGQAMNYHALYLALRGKQQAAGLPSGLHNTRRTTASYMHNATSARDLLGHTSINITNRYLFSQPEDLRAEVDQLPWAQ